MAKQCAADKCARKPERGFPFCSAHRLALPLDIEISVRQAAKHGAADELARQTERAMRALKSPGRGA